MLHPRGTSQPTFRAHTSMENLMRKPYRCVFVFSLLCLIGFNSNALAQNCPCSIWGPTATPDTADSLDAIAGEFGVKFRSDANGLVTGIRFYKSAANFGAQVVNLWSSNGTL